MKKALPLIAALIILIGSLFFSAGATMAEENGEHGNEEMEQRVNEGKKEKPAEQDIKLFYGADLRNLNEVQMALLMVNNQIEYLMLQIEDKKNQMDELKNQHEERLAREAAIQAELKNEHAAAIEQLQKQLGEKERELALARDEIHSLEKHIATYISDSWLYFLLLAALLVGLLFGFLLSSILNWRRRKNLQSTAQG